MIGTVHIIGASGRSGQSLCRSLLADGVPVVPIVRSAESWQRARIWGEPRIAALADPQGLAKALADATMIVSCAHAVFAPAVLAAAPATARFVFLGSTRKFTRWPDEHGTGVQAGENAFLASGRAGVMLHPTMIYGAEGEDNVQRLAAWLRRLRWLRLMPLPNGGRSLVQPIYQNDVTRAVRAALERPWTKPHALVIAGPQPIPYAQFVQEVARAAGLPPPRIVRMPAAPMRAAANLARLLPGLPRIEPEEIRRLLEDKAFDVTPMVSWLGLRPTSLSDGLAATFGAAGA